MELKFITESAPIKKEVFDSIKKRIEAGPGKKVIVESFTVFHDVYDDYFWESYLKERKI